MIDTLNEPVTKTPFPFTISDTDQSGNLRTLYVYPLGSVYWCAWQGQTVLLCVSERPKTALALDGQYLRSHKESPFPIQSCWDIEDCLI